MDGHSCAGWFLNWPLNFQYQEGKGVSATNFQWKKVSHRLNNVFLFNNEYEEEKNNIYVYEVPHHILYQSFTKPAQRTLPACCIQTWCRHRASLHQGCRCFELGKDLLSLFLDTSSREWSIPPFKTLQEVENNCSRAKYQIILLHYHYLQFGPERSKLSKVASLKWSFVEAKLFIDSDQKS